jgi:beta-phosphoglucomutase
MPISLCIFDLDGVIVDTAKYHYMAWKRLARQRFNKDFTMTEEEKTLLAEQKNTWYVEYIGQITKDEILPGVMHFLTDVKKNGIKTGIGSASKNTRMILERLELISMFDSIIDGTRITLAKPDPEVFLKCSGELGIKPKHCVVFEDAAAGIEAALAAGMIAVGIGDRDILGRAHLVIPSLKNYTVNDMLKMSERNSV